MLRIHEAAAEFWSAVLGDPVTYDDADFVVVAANDQSSGLSLQRAPGNPRPTWPADGVAQQMHLDVMVDDLAAAAPLVLAIGARHLRGDVYADPEGHPFCLITRPGWAARSLPEEGSARSAQPGYGGRDLIGGDTVVTTTVSVPKVGALAATRVALGFGVGLLVADRLEPSLRRRIGSVLVAVGVVSTVPLVRSLIQGIDPPGGAAA